MSKNAALLEQLRGLGYAPKEIRGCVFVTDRAHRNLQVTKMIDGYAISERRTGKQTSEYKFHVSALMQGLWQGLHTRSCPGRVAPDEFIRERLEFHKAVLKEET